MIYKVFSFCLIYNLTLKNSQLLKIFLQIIISRKTNLYSRHILFLLSDFCSARFFFHFLVRTVSHRATLFCIPFFKKNFVQIENGNDDSRSRFISYPYRYSATNRHFASLFNLPFFSYAYIRICKHIRHSAVNFRRGN